MTKLKEEQTIIITAIPDPNDVKDGVSVRFEFNEVMSYPDVKVSSDCKKVIEGYISQTSYIPKEKDRLYFYPKCNVARFKVRSWGEKNKIRVTVKEDTASARFINSEEYESLVSRFSMSTIKKTAFVSWLNSNYKDLESESLTELNDALKSVTSEYIFLTNALTNQSKLSLNDTIADYSAKTVGIKRAFQEFMSDPNEECKRYADFYGSNIEQYASLQRIGSYTNVYDQRDIINIVNEDSLVIDAEMYEELDIMLTNSDRGNQVLALEIMANCNFKPSLHNLLDLISEHNSTIYSLKESQHVNFKGLLSYIGVDRGYMDSINDSKIMNILIEKEALTAETLSEFAMKAKKRMAEAVNNSFFEVKTIQVTDKVKDYFVNLHKPKTEEDEHQNSEQQ